VGVQIPPLAPHKGASQRMTSEAEGYLKEIRSTTGLKRILEFEVPREQVESQVEQLIAGMKKEVALPGFRKGRVPLDVLRARFGETARKEVIERLIPEAYQKALEKESLRPVLPAEISSLRYGEEGPLSFQIAIEVFPKVEISSYKGIKVKMVTRTVQDADVDREIEALRNRLAIFSRLERLGKDGKPVANSKVANYPFELGSAGLLREFSQGLAGVRRGEQRTVEVTYPDDFAQEELGGKTLTFLVEAKEVGERVLPEVNERFAEQLGTRSLLDLRVKVRESLEQAYEEDAKAKAKRDVVATIVKESSFEVPQGLVEVLLESMMESYQRESDDSKKNQTKERLQQIQERLRPVAVNIVKEQFIIDDIAKRENIVVEDKEIEEIISAIASRTGLSVEETRKRAVEADQISHWYRDLLKSKVLDFLLEQSEIESAQAETAEHLSSEEKTSAVNPAGGQDAGSGSK
jgi:trigger factor